MVHLTVISPGTGDQQTFEFTQNVIRLGRLKDNDIPLNGANISRLHCQIVREEGEYVLLDNSSNGTLLNGRVVGQAQRRPLRDGDRIGIGDFVVRLELPKQPEDFEKTTDFLQMKFAQLIRQAGPEPTSPALLVAGGPTNGTRFELTQDMDEVLLGRTPDCPLQIPVNTVSKHHARVIRHGPTVELEDLGSANGTRVNGAPLTGPRVLHDRDEIVLGQPGMDDPIRILFTWPGAVSPVDAPCSPADPSPAGEPLPAQEAVPSAEVVRPPEAEAPSSPSLPVPPSSVAETMRQPQALPAPPAVPEPVEPGGVKAGLGLLEYTIIGAAGLAVLAALVLVVWLLT